MDETEVYTDTPAYYLEDGDQIVWKGENIVLDTADDLGEVIRIGWRDAFDMDQTDDLDPETAVDLWRYV